jgi:phosphoglycolate phosphatase
MSDKQIDHFFTGIFGIDNHLGAGKTMAAAELMQKIGCEPSRTVIIGDTLHDSEVAQILKTDCILVAHGHQSYERLKKTGHTVVHDLMELMEMF